MDCEQERNLFILDHYCQNWYEIYQPIREIFANLEDEIEDKISALFPEFRYRTDGQMPSFVQPGQTYRDHIEVS